MLNPTASMTECRRHPTEKAGDHMNPIYEIYDELCDALTEYEQANEPDSLELYSRVVDVANKLAEMLN